MAADADERIPVPDVPPNAAGTVCACFHPDYIPLIVDALLDYYTVNVWPDDDAIRGDQYLRLLVDAIRNAT